MTIPPFVSLDFPLSCDTVSICGDGIDMNIYDMIFAAPECSLGGRFPADRCGITLDSSNL